MGLPNGQTNWSINSEDQKSSSSQKTQSTGKNDASLYSIENEYHEMNTDRIHKIRKSNCLFDQLFQSEFCLVFFSLVGLVLSIIQREFHNKKNNDNDDKDLLDQDRVDIVFFIGFYDNIVTLLLCFSTYIKYDIRLKWFKSINKYVENDNLISTGIWKVMALDILTNAIKPYIYLNNTYIQEYLGGSNVSINY